MRKIDISYQLQASLLKRETEHDEIYEDNWEEKENEWLPDLKIDVISTVFCYARYIKGMEDLTIFSMKNSLTLPSLANKYFHSLGEKKTTNLYILLPIRL